MSDVGTLVASIVTVVIVMASLSYGWQPYGHMIAASFAVVSMMAIGRVFNTELATVLRTMAASAFYAGSGYLAYRFVVRDERLLSIVRLAAGTAVAMLNAWMVGSPVWQEPASRHNVHTQRRVPCAPQAVMTTTLPETKDTPAAIPAGAFEFGKNWASFLASVEETRIDQSIAALRSMLGVKSLVGKRFLDLGCGSGLSSLAAYRLGAEIVSVDYDPQCVSCAETLRRRFASDDRWVIRQGSVLDDALIKTLEPADIVYSWGVLHHTGSMREAVCLAASRVRSGGLFFIAIYNDQGGASRRWLKIKQIYNRLPHTLRPVWVMLIAGVYELRFAVVRAAQLRNPLPFADWKKKKSDRGMSAWHDWVDWVGGLPFEVAKVEEMVVPLREQGFVLENLKTVGSGWGCNEFVFRRLS